jgi:hypothetical protein
MQFFARGMDPSDDLVQLYLVENFKHAFDIER